MRSKKPLAGVYRVEVFGSGVTAGFSGRSYDNSRRGEFLNELGLDPVKLVMVKQVHGNTVLAVDAPDPKFHEMPADGLVTDQTGFALGVRTADCVPVFFHDPVNRVIGIAHGGWKGVKEGIVPQTIETFRVRFHGRPEDLRVVIGPSIRACCYEVGNEFKDHFPDFYRLGAGVKGRLDLVGVVQGQLTAAGVLKENIHDTGLCTVCRNDLFYSYRVERQTKERILNVISLVPRQD